MSMFRLSNDRAKIVSIPLFFRSYDKPYDQKECQAYISFELQQKDSGRLRRIETDGQVTHDEVRCSFIPVCQKVGLVLNLHKIYERLCFLDYYE